MVYSIEIGLKLRLYAAHKILNYHEIVSRQLNNSAQPNWKLKAICIEKKKDPVLMCVMCAKKKDNLGKANTNKKMSSANYLTHSNTYTELRAHSI